MSADLAAFLLARLAEDEEMAWAASPGPWKPNAEHDEVLAVDDITVAEGFALSSRQQRATVDHIARHDPARVLADVEAKRLILADHPNLNADWGPPDDEYSLQPICARCEDRKRHDALAWPCPTLRAIGLSYADHPDYRPGWKP